MLEIQVSSRLIHLLAQVIYDFFVLTLQEKNHLLDHCIVFFARGVSNAGSDTAVNIELRARTRQQPLLPSCRRLGINWWGPVTGVIAAGAKGKKFIQQIQRLIYSPTVWLPPQVTISATLETSSPQDPPGAPTPSNPYL